MLNVLTILTDDGNEIRKEAKMTAEVLADSDTSVSAVEYCLAGCDCKEGNTGEVVEVAKEDYVVTDMMTFSFECYEQTGTLLENFITYCVEHKHVDLDTQLDAATFLECISELVIDMEKVDGVVKVVSTLLEPVRKEK